jgi:hypothetical protein
MSQQYRIPTILYLFSFPSPETQQNVIIRQEGGRSRLGVGDLSIEFAKKGQGPC